VTPLNPTQAFARSLKQGRLLRDLNQQRLAERLTELGFPTAQSTIARIETGKRGVTLDDAVAISIALDIPLPNMIAGTAVEGYEVALTPKEVLTAELANSTLLGKLELGEERPLYSRLDFQPPDARDRRDELVRQGKVFVTTDEDGVTTTASRPVSFKPRLDDRG
jgi:transcriptional regulator with XRE-family HTH domain